MHWPIFCHFTEQGLESILLIIVKNMHGIGQHEANFQFPDLKKINDQQGKVVTCFGVFVNTEVMFCWPLLGGPMYVCERKPV